MLINSKASLESLKETLNNMDNITFYTEEFSIIEKDLYDFEYVKKGLMKLGVCGLSDFEVFISFYESLLKNIDRGKLEKIVNECDAQEIIRRYVRNGI